MPNNPNFINMNPVFSQNSTFQAIVNPYCMPSMCQTTAYWLDDFPALFTFYGPVANHDPLWHQGGPLYTIQSVTGQGSLWFAFHPVRHGWILYFLLKDLFEIIDCPFFICLAMFTVLISFPEKSSNERLTKL